MGRGLQEAGRVTCLTDFGPEQVPEGETDVMAVGRRAGLWGGSFWVVTLQGAAVDSSVSAGPKKDTANCPFLTFTLTVTHGLQ